MKSLYVRIWLTVVAALALFALAGGALLQRHVQQERQRIENAAQGRIEAWADLLQRSLPGPDAPPAEQAAALRDWAQRLRVPMALDDAAGARIGSSEAWARREAELGGATASRRALPMRLDDGRTLWVARAGPARRADGTPGPGGPRQPIEVLVSPPGLPEGSGLLILLALLFVAVAAGAYPVVRRLTRRLESLKQGVEAFGAGALDHRVDTGGRDEVAALATSFNHAAARIEGLLKSHQSLLANASHELRSPLARLKMAVALLEDAPAGAARERLRQEIDTNIGELDSLVEEVLLASRLDAAAGGVRDEPVELLALAAEEAARCGATLDGEAVTVRGDERLLRRALRNLLDNARRYGGDEVKVELRREAGNALLRVCDRGPGVPEAHRERIFEPFFRLPGHAEREGGVGLGLALVRQIANRHRGSVQCQARSDGHGSCFTLTLPG